MVKTKTATNFELRIQSNVDFVTALQNKSGNRIYLYTMTLNFSSCLKIQNMKILIVQFT